MKKIIPAGEAGQESVAVGTAIGAEIKNNQAATAGEATLVGHGLVQSIEEGIARIKASMTNPEREAQKREELRTNLLSRIDYYKQLRGGALLYVNMFQESFAQSGGPKDETERMAWAQEKIAAENYTKTIDQTTQRYIKEFGVLPQTGFVEADVDQIAPDQSVN